MNRQNFETKDRFPLSTQALTFMQDMVLASARLALIGGDRYILSGCAAAGNTVQPGTLVIDGEIIPFDGGTKNTTLTIIETPISVSANGLTFDNARIARKAVFASGTGENYLPWADFHPLPTNKQLHEAKATVAYVDDQINKIRTGGIPAGVITLWSGPVSEIPGGWQLCDGTVIPGTNGKKTPDLRGRFIVGYNPSETEYDLIGKYGGQKTISLSPDNLPGHKHPLSLATQPGGNHSHNLEAFDGGSDRVQNPRRVSTGAWNTPATYTTPAAGEHTHQISGDTGNTGAGKEFNILPPYYVLAFIIKL